MQPIRVLHVLGRLDRGGAETMVMNIYRKIDRNKVQFDFVIHTKDKCDYSDEIRSMGGRIFSVPKYNVKNHIKYIKEWKRFFDKNREYKIIHGHVRSTGSLYLGVAKKYGLTTIAHSHNTSSGKGIKALVKNILQKSLTKYSDFLFACSNDAGKWLFGDNVINDNRYHLIKNAIDVKKFDFHPIVRTKIREELMVDETLLVGHVGRFHPQKNHDFIIDVFSELHSLRPDVALVLIGEGDLLPNIKKKVEKLSLSDSVIFTGVREDVAAYLQAIDIFLLPSLYEGLGIVVVEAQAASCSCLVSDSVPLDVKVTDLVNFMSLSEGKHAWAKKILEISKNQNRKSRMNEIFDSGYHIDGVGDWYQEFYLREHENNKGSI